MLSRSGVTRPQDGNNGDGTAACDIDAYEVEASGEILDGLDLGATFTGVPGGTARWTFTEVTGNYSDQSGDVSIVIGKADATCTIPDRSSSWNG